MSRRVRLWGGVVMAAGLSGAFSSLSAQSIGDTVPRSRTIPLRQEVKSQVTDSRYVLGPFRIQPTLSIQSLEYNNNIFGSSDHPVSDYTSTVTGGARFIAPFGQKLFLRGEFLPEYHWYARHADQRSVGGVYNASAFALFNRMSVEADGTRSATLPVVSSETQRVARENFSAARIKTEVDVLPRISVFAGAAFQQHRLRSPSKLPSDFFEVSQLDRRDVQAQTGVRYYVTTFFDVSAALETTRSRFEAQAAQRNNYATAYLIGLHYDLPRIFLNLSAGRRMGRPLDGSTFPAYSTATGSWFASYFLSVPAEVQAYGHRGIVNGLAVETPYFFETRSGVAVNWQAGRRFVFRTFGEIGNNRYSNPSFSAGTSVTRADRVATYGAGLSTPLYHDLWFTVLASRDRFNSNFAEFDRSLFKVTSALVYRPKAP